MGSTISMLLQEKCGAPRMVFPDRVETRAEVVVVEVIERLRDRSCLDRELADSEDERESWFEEMYCSVAKEPEAERWMEDELGVDESMLRKFGIRSGWSDASSLRLWPSWLNSILSQGR